MIVTFIKIKIQYFLNFSNFFYYTYKIIFKLYIIYVSVKIYSVINYLRMLYVSEKERFVLFTLS